MAFSITRTFEGFVRPSEQTPSGIHNLSAIDTLPSLRFNTKTLHVFKHGPEAATVIKQALAKALVPYYPLAGRLKESSFGHLLQIDCSGQGVLFVEASSTSDLHSVNYFDNVSSIPFDLLLPSYVPETDETLEPLVQIQVTQFACGGFVIGLIFSHTICDGLGAAQFLNAVGEAARGLDHFSVTPVWCRDFSSPPHEPENVTNTVQFTPPLPIPSYELEPANIDISIDQINQLKKQFHEATSQTCSTFEVVTATFWRNRTIAINWKQNTEVKLVFFANCRQILNLPTGFYGNCFFPVIITAYTEALIQASNIQVIKLIQEAKAKLPIKFSKYLNGAYLKDGGEDPFTPPLAYTTLFVSEWGRLGFNQVDYSWGAPMHLIPVPFEGSSSMPVGIVGSLPLPNKGIRLMTWCVDETHRRQFIELIMKAI